MTKPASKKWMHLIAGILFALLGIAAIATGHLGSATVRELQTSGLGARFVGILYIIIALMLLGAWLKNLMRRHER
jgi:uncharacterized membrane protein YczE